MSHPTKVKARKPDVVYKGGRRRNGSTRVIRDGLDFENLTVRGKNFAAHYEWGDAASASHQLGLNVLFDQFGPDAALELHRAFTTSFIALLPAERFEFSGRDVEHAVNQIYAKQLQTFFTQPVPKRRWRIGSMEDRCGRSALRFAAVGLLAEIATVSAAILDQPKLARTTAIVSLGIGAISLALVIATLWPRRVER